MNRQISDVTPQRSSKSFLQRFQGRTSTIGKAGLLSLLQNNNSPSKHGHEGLARYMDEGNIRQRTNDNKYEVERFSINKLDEVEKRASNQSFRTQPRRSSMGSMSNLGSTNRYSQKSSIYEHKFALHAPLNSMSSAQLKNDKKTKIIQMNNSQNLRSMNGYDDKFKHLEFLNLFEERMKKRENK